MTDPIDLLDYLWQKYQAANPYEMIPDIHQPVISFIKHSREVLLANQPVGLDYLGATTSLRLQDSTVVPVVAVPETGEAVPRQMSNAAGFMPVGKSTPAVDGKGAIAPSPAWGVTGQ